MPATSSKNQPILVWGIAGASLGMEIAKCLVQTGYRNIIGCDISPIAFGHYAKVFQRTCVIDRNRTKESLGEILSEYKPTFALAGGDQVSRLMSSFEPLFQEHNCRVCGNSPEVVNLASDKLAVNDHLEKAGFRVPRTVGLEATTDLNAFAFPVILKPRRDSGGSRGVAIATDRPDLEAKIATVLASGENYIIQEYVSDSEGEYTIGVLSNTDGSVAGSIIMRRTFQNMLSVHEKKGKLLISSGSSQGIFEKNQVIQKQAEAIAVAVGSVGPLNIQARRLGSDLAPFEINPRFSASTYLRALSGVNEVDLYLQHLATGNRISYPDSVEGLALRSFTEVFVSSSEVPSDVF